MTVGDASVPSAPIASSIASSRRRYWDARRVDAVDAGHGVILVGEDNPISARPEHALLHFPPGCAGHLLQSRILGLRRATYLSIWRVNLCVGGWSDVVARDRASRLIEEGVPWSAVVLLGAKVSRALSFAASAPTGCGRFSSASFPLFSVTRTLPSSVPRVSVVCIPHPSGRSRSWNDPAGVDRARDLLRRAAPDVPWGELDDPSKEGAR